MNYKIESKYNPRIGGDRHTLYKRVGPCWMSIASTTDSMVKYSWEQHYKI